MKHIVFPVLLLSICNLVNSQTPDLNLNELTEEELLVVIDSTENKELAKEASKFYLMIGKTKNDTIIIARAYDRISRSISNDTSLIYADSIISLTKNLNHKTYPGIGYLLKASYLSNKRLYNEALENYAKAQEYAISQNNVIHELYIRKCIIDITSRWSSPLRGIELSKNLIKFIDTLDYEKILKSSSRPDFEINPVVLRRLYLKDRLDALSSLITSYILNKDYEEALHFSSIAEELIEELMDEDKSISLKRRVAEIEYYRGNFKKSFDTLSKYVSRLELLNSKLNSYYYLGMNSLKMGNTEEGLKHLLIADSLFDIEPYIVPSQRPFLTELYRLYKEKGDKLSQVKILNKLLVVDSLFKHSYKKINRGLIDDFETPLLLAEKEKLIAQLEWEQGKEKRKQLFTVGLLFLSLGAGFYYFWKQNQYKKRFQALIKNGLEDQQELKTDQRRNDISAAIVEDILQKLERFESKHQFTRKDTSLQSVAKRFNTNSSYLSKVVNLKKDKNFSQYISELRIAYAVDQLKNNPRFRKYTIKAIAEEVGFGNAQSFSKAFYSRTGIQPSYFIRNLNKQKQTDFIADSIPQTE
ncbi:helix-turn-helix domain-containing protein [Gilvibacter sp.]|uniref:helix-turn-helix domain-containing protein n=1 Tax=Gilvibacter sp. TaxID=2729997 RepID=UPI003B521151